MNAVLAWIRMNCKFAAPAQQIRPMQTQPIHPRDLPPMGGALDMMPSDIDQWSQGSPGGSKEAPKSIPDELKHYQQALTARSGHPELKRIRIELISSILKSAPSQWDTILAFNVERWRGPYVYRQLTFTISPTFAMSFVKNALLANPPVNLLQEIELSPQNFKLLLNDPSFLKEYANWFMIDSVDMAHPYEMPEFAPGFNNDVVGASFKNKLLEDPSKWPFMPINAEISDAVKDRQEDPDDEEEKDSIWDYLIDRTRTYMINTHGQDGMNLFDNQAMLLDFENAYTMIVPELAKYPYPSQQMMNNHGYYSNFDERTNKIVYGSKIYKAIVPLTAQGQQILEDLSSIIPEL